MPGCLRFRAYTWSSSGVVFWGTTVLSLSSPEAGPSTSLFWNLLCLASLSQEIGCALMLLPGSSALNGSPESW